ncbi:MAG: hypothetical protein EHM45_20145 [Desulfobacteraceae bacterium]|nr:MAG: hypothetical protein EHM45_20145 [Desulfobacteraceae bacterium]
MKLNPDILKRVHDGILVHIAPSNQKNFQTALIVHYDEEGLWLRTLFGILPGQALTIGMSALNNRSGSQEIEAMLRVQIVWCKWVQTDKGAYFITRANYDNQYVEGYAVLTY